MGHQSHLTSNWARPGLLPVIWVGLGKGAAIDIGEEEGRNLLVEDGGGGPWHALGRRYWGPNSGCSAGGYSFKVSRAYSRCVHEHTHESGVSDSAMLSDTGPHPGQHLASTGLCCELCYSPDILTPMISSLQQSTRPQTNAIIPSTTRSSSPQRSCLPNNALAFASSRFCVCQ